MRLAFQAGDVELASAGAANWGYAETNRPLFTGDRLETGNNGRAALELGGASVRISNDSDLSVLDLDSSVAQFELSQGALNLRVRHMNAGQTYEVDTTTLAFVASQPGNYRVDVGPDGKGTTLTVFSGSGIVYGENGVSRPVRAGQAYWFDDSRLIGIRARRISAPDGFDRFCMTRDMRRDHSASSRYVSPDMIGYDDLDGYGDWRQSADYGAVWYPSHVARDWAPYHDGHWAWVDPWGWTWVDNAAWGFAPSHYGRWAYVGDRWGWVPGPRVQRAVYAPALVAFVGGARLSIGANVGGGEPVGWFPLGPRDVYQPPYRVTRDYFTNINVTNVKVVNTTVINNVYNNYSMNRPSAPIAYANRNVPGAVTVVPRNVFTGARPVAVASLKLKPQDLAQATVTPVVRVAPTGESEGVRPGARPAGMPMARPDHAVIARHAPPPPPAPFAARVKAVADQGGKPLAPMQLHEMGKAHAGGQPPHVVIASPGASPSVPRAQDRTPASGMGAPGTINPPTPARPPQVKSDVAAGPAEPRPARNPPAEKVLRNPPAQSPVVDRAVNGGVVRAPRPGSELPQPRNPIVTSPQEPNPAATSDRPDRPMQHAHRPPAASPVNAAGGVASGPAEPKPVRTPPAMKPPSDQAGNPEPVRAPRMAPPAPRPAPPVLKPPVSQQQPPIREQPNPAMNQDGGDKLARPAQPAPPRRERMSRPPQEASPAAPVAAAPVGTPEAVRAPRAPRPLVRPPDTTAPPVEHREPAQRPQPPAAVETPAQRAEQKRKDDKAREDQKKKDEQDQQQH